MAKSLAGKFVRVSVANGKFFINPVKKAYKEYKESFTKATYNAWVIQNEGECFVPDTLKDEPLISVVVPAYNPDPSHYLAMVYSVVNQHYENWELIIVNASDALESKRRITSSAEIDTRIKVVEPEENLGIAGNTNYGLEHCKGKYIAFLDHDDLLHACALHSIAYAATENDAELIYTDEDKIKADNSVYFEPFLKPGWSPDLLENVNYINHLTAVKASYVEKVKGLRPKFDGAQDYDFLLRVIDICKPKIEHIARVLYHWRAAETSTASDFSNKTYVLQAGTRALEEHLERQGINGSVKAIKNRPGFYETLPSVPKRISIVIGPVDKTNHRLCIIWLAELSKKVGKHIQAELVIGDWLEAYKHKLAFASIQYVKSAKNNYWDEASKLVNERVVLSFSLAALPDDSLAISRLAALASSSDKKVIAPFITSQAKTILDAGLVESDYGKQRLFTGCELGDNTYYGSTEWIRNVAGLTLNIFATCKENFVALTHNKTGQSLSDTDLEKLEKTDTSRLIVNPHALFIFNGALRADTFSNDQYFNPQLNQAQSRINVKIPYWNDLRALSEKNDA